MKKFAFLILSLALAFGCQPADEGSGDSGDSTPVETDGGEEPADDDSADATTEDATKMVALKITSELRWANGWARAIEGTLSGLPGVVSAKFDQGSKVVTCEIEGDFDTEGAISALGDKKYTAVEN